MPAEVWQALGGEIDIKSPEELITPVSSRIMHRGVQQLNLDSEETFKSKNKVLSHRQMAF